MAVRQELFWKMEKNIRRHCRDCGHRRSCLSKHRFHWRRLPFCKRDGAYRDRAVSSTGSYEHQRRYSRKASGTFPEKCPKSCPRWMEKSGSTKISGKWCLAHFGVTGPLILRASSAVGAKQRGKELTLSIDLKTGAFRRAVRCQNPAGL